MKWGGICFKICFEFAYRCGRTDPCFLSIDAAFVNYQLQPDAVLLTLGSVVGWLI